MNEQESGFRKFTAVLSVLIMFVLGASLSFRPMDSDAADVDFNEYAEKIIILVNEARAEEGLKPVYAVPYLNDLSNIRVRELVEYWNHKRPDGSKFSSVIDQSIAPFWYAAENIAAGFSTPEETFEQWKNSPKHWEAIMNPDVTHMGAAVTYEGNSTYRWYWQQLFIQSAKSEPFEGQYIPERYKIVPKCCGDLNGDDAVDMFDYILLMQYITDENDDVYLNDLQIESADCLKDGSITLADAVILQKYILKSSIELPIKLF
ncbi:MAG: SCP-like extracellular [Ruminococcus sp.]|nr:SCP-like extracellular [Ruminococcus sp.]